MTKNNKIFILHGWTYDIGKWENFITLLGKRGIRVEMLNIPGLTAKSDKVWDIDSYVDWLDDKLRKEKDVVLLGHSNGGRIALSYCLSHPEKVKSLILIDSAGIRNNSVYMKTKRAIFGKIAKYGKSLTEAQALRKLLYKVARESDYEKAPDNMKKTMANMIAVDLRESLSKINIPTIIIWGENDKLTPLNDGVLIHKKIKDSKLFIIKGAMHAPFYTDTEEVVDILANNL